MAFPSGYPRPMFGSLQGDAGAVYDPMAYSGPYGGRPNFVSEDVASPIVAAPQVYAPAPVRARPRRKIKLGPVHRCKVVSVKQRDGKTKRRRLCWDKQGHLVRNSAAGSKGGKGSTRKRRVKCTLKCPKGSSPYCKGGFRSSGKGRGGKQVCRKWVCRRRKGK
jgi:hypothetical protein